MTKEEFAALKVGDIIACSHGTVRVRVIAPHERCGFRVEHIPGSYRPEGEQEFATIPEVWRKLPAPEAEEVRGWRKSRYGVDWPVKDAPTQTCLYYVQLGESTDSRWAKCVRHVENREDFETRGRPLTLREVVDIIAPPEAEEKLPPILDANGREIRVGDVVTWAPSIKMLEPDDYAPRVIGLHQDHCGRRVAGAVRLDNGNWASDPTVYTKDVPVSVGNRLVSAAERAAAVREAAQPTEAGAVCAELPKRCEACDAMTAAVCWEDDLPYCIYCSRRESSSRESGPGIGTVEPVVDVEGECWERPGWES